MQLPDYVRRALRSFVQAWAGAFLLLTATAAANVLQGELPDLALLQRAALAATFAGVIAVVALIHNWAEDTTPFPAIGKAPTSAGEHPVPDPSGPQLERHTPR